MRILLITRHYPPAVSGGAKRPFLLASALRKMGCEVFVVAPSLPEGELGVAIPHPNRDPEPNAGQRAVNFSLRAVAREWLLWPDPDIRWVKHTANIATSAAPWTPDWIWTTSPPESVHAAGVSLQKKYNAKWMADFRDHWLDRPHRQERAAPHRRIGEKFVAKRWLAKADIVTCVDRFIASELRALGARDPVVAPHFKPNLIPAPVDLPTEDINVVHTGSIALSDPLAQIGDLLAPFEHALASNPELRLHLVGRLTRVEEEAIKASPAKARITHHGVQSFEKALSFQQAADGLILVGSEKTRVPPSKIAEYFAAAAPIIVCGQGDWLNDERLTGKNPVEALATLRRGAQRAHTVEPPSVNDVAAQLLSLMKKVT